MDDQLSKETTDPVALPPPEVLREIERKQDERAKELAQKYGNSTQSEEDARRASAATLIQKSYRGHRARRALKGYGLDPSTRWVEVCVGT
jgi:hypothetical protein